METTSTLSLAHRVRIRYHRRQPTHVSTNKYVEKRGVHANLPKWLSKQDLILSLQPLLFETFNASLRMTQEYQSSTVLHTKLEICLHVTLGLFDLATLQHTAVALSLTSVSLTPLSLTTLSFAPLSLASVSLTPLSLTHLSFAPLSLTPLSLTPLSLAPLLSLTLLSLAPLSLTPLAKSHSSNFCSSKSCSFKPHSSKFCSSKSHSSS